MRVSSSVAVRSNAGYDARLVGAFERGVGNAPVHETRMGRELGTDLPDPVAQRDHHVETLRDELVEMLGAVPADVDTAPFQRTRTALACNGFGLLPALSASNRSGRHVFEERLRDLRACAVPRAQEQHALPATRTPRGRPRHGHGAGRATARDGARHPPLAARPGSERDRSRSSGRGHPPSCAAPTRAHRHAADPSGTTPGSAARRPAASTPTPPDRSRPAPATAATAPDAPQAARTPADHQHRGVDTTVGSTSHTVPTDADYPIKLRLMYSGRGGGGVQVLRRGGVLTAYDGGYARIPVRADQGAGGE